MKIKLSVLAFVFGFTFIAFISSTGALSQTDYINSWLICGPFENSNLRTECFRNEAGIRPQAKEVYGGREWKSYFSFENYLNFEEAEAFGSCDNCVGYAWVEIKSPERKEVKLLLGSDDGIKVWLNGRNVLTNDVGRSLSFDEDKVNIILEPGWNRLLLKVSDIMGGWSFSARFSDYRGLPVSGLEYRPRPLKVLPVKEATASSVEADKPGFSPASVIDGSLSTRWSSCGNDSQWVCLDLGVPAEINKIVLLWEAAYAEEYKIELSNDKENWVEVYFTSSGDGDKDFIALKKPQTARYVRFYGIKRANKNWGYSLFEFQVFGSESNQVLKN